jgi:ubiquinone/menaquinone biosynthesis C-methylase UbiE
MAQYGRVQYWEDRYTDSPERFEWYQNYEGIRSHVHTHLRPNFRLLHVGAGNSRISESLHKDGFVDVTNVDISPTVTEQMIQATSHLQPPMSWLVMDVRSMEFSDESYDAVLDKGCYDTVLAGEQGERDADKFLQGVARILRPKGVFMCVSTGIPSERLPMLTNQDYSWDVECIPLPKPVVSEDGEKFDPQDDQVGCHWMYVCKTGGHDDEG